MLVHSKTWWVVLLQFSVLTGVAVNGNARPIGEEINRDKTGTSASPQNTIGPQMPNSQALASRMILEAEGMGLEPTTGCPAPEFQSGR